MAYLTCRAVQPSTMLAALSEPAPCHNSNSLFQLYLMRRLGVSLFAQGFLGMSTKSSALTTRHRALQASRERCEEWRDRIKALQNQSCHCSGQLSLILTVTRAVCVKR